MNRHAPLRPRCHRRHTLLALLLAGTTPLLAADDLATALAHGDASLALRLRHEQVDTEGNPRDAQATTLRTRLGYVSGRWHNLDAQLEFDHVAHLFDARFNDTRNGNLNYPLVLDPKGTDLNQAVLRYHQEQLTLAAGRQRILYDNQRFIGNVGWRQNEQTYDAVRLTLQPLSTLTLDVSWIDNTRRIFGPEDGPAPREAQLDSNHHLVNLAWQHSPALQASAYLYALDFADSPALSSRTAGLALKGEMKREDTALIYHAEAARQQDHGDNAVDYRALYHLLTVGVRYRGAQLSLHQERLGADRDQLIGFSTPLATAHAFQGWADVLTTTPINGIVDNYLTLAGTLRNTSLQAVWHEYSPDLGSGTYGTELNLLASRTFARRYTLTAKFADYRAEDFAVDNTKVWVMAEASF